MLLVCLAFPLGATIFCLLSAGCLCLSLLTAFKLTSGSKVAGSFPSTSATRVMTPSHHPAGSGSSNIATPHTTPLSAAASKRGSATDTAARNDDVHAGLGDTPSFASATTISARPAGSSVDPLVAVLGFIATVAVVVDGCCVGG